MASNRKIGENYVSESNIKKQYKIKKLAPPPRYIIYSHYLQYATIALYRVCCLVHLSKVNEILFIPKMWRYAFTSLPILKSTKKISSVCTIFVVNISHCQ